MSDLINGRELLKRYQEDLCYGIACKDCSMCTEDGGCRVEEWIDKFPSADRPQDDDWEKYSDKLWKNAYERGKADGAMIYGNEHNCIMTIFGECSYAETGCGDCAVVEKVRKALSTDRPQGEWIDAEIPLESGGSMPIQACNLCKTFYPLAYTGGGHRFCPNCGARMKGADDE